MPVTRLTLSASLALALASPLAIAPAHALTMKECSAKYSAAKEAGTLGNLKWNDFRKTQCGSDGDAAVAAPDAATSDKMAAASTAEIATTDQTRAPSSADSKPPVTTTVVPNEVTFPTSISSKYASETPAKARMHTCLDEYHLNKNNNTLGGLKWVQKGGGYYGLCNTKLKS
jgi:hypothetical protein